MNITLYSHVVAIPAIVKIPGSSLCWQPTSLRMCILMLLNQFIKLYVYNTIILLSVLMRYPVQCTVMKVVRDI